jgi:hypothetical protein
MHSRTDKPATAIDVTGQRLAVRAADGATQWIGTDDLIAGSSASR